MENSWIPPGKEDAVRRALEAVFPGRAVDAATAITGGASAQVFRLRLGTDTVLLRIEGARDAFRDPLRGYACMAIAAQAGVAPAMHYANAQDGVAITDFIEADAGPPPPERIVALARAVRALHDTPLFPPLVDFVDGVGMILDGVRQAGVLSPPSFDQLMALYRACAAVYPRAGSEAVSSHNDLNPNNVLFASGRVWLVDWESAFAADRYVDLAALANYRGAGAADMEILLNAYFGAPPDALQKARLTVMRRINRLFYTGVLLAGAAAERPGFHLSAEALAGFRLADYGADRPSVTSFDGRLQLARAFFNDTVAGAGEPNFIAALEMLGRV